jgi:hypothetical protein
MYDKNPVAAFTLTLVGKPYTPEALQLDRYKQLTLGDRNAKYNGIFTFVPGKTGDYCFSSSSDGIDLAADLLGANMAILASNDDGLTRYYTPGPSLWFSYGLDFKLVYRLEQGKTYFLSVRNIDGYWYNYGDDGSASVLVEEAYLKAAAGTSRVTYEEYPPFHEIFPSNYDMIDVSASWEYFNYSKIYYPTLVTFGYGYVAAKTGTTTVSAEVMGVTGVPKVQANVRISYNWWQWLLVIFCFGWIWL